MKLFVLCAREDKERAIDILRLARTLDLTGLALAIGPLWRTEQRRLDEHLASATHLVVVLSEAANSSSWLPFVSGLCLGSEKPLVLLRTEKTVVKEAFLAPFFLIPSLDDLGSFLETERREWKAGFQRREARRELLELGVSLRGESFAETVREGNLHAAELFIRSGLSADSRDRKGVPLLCLAAREGNAAMLRLLLSNGAGIDMQSEDRANSALMDAVAGGYEMAVHELLQAKAALDLQSKDGQTALVIAVGKSDVSMASLLLQAGASPDLADKLGFSARKYARLFHNPAMTGLFEKYPLPD